MPEVAEILKLALEALNTASVPEKLRPVAFAKAVDLLTGTSSTAPVQQPSDTGTGSTPDDNGDVPDRLVKIAEKLGVPASRIEELFHIADEKLRLSLHNSQLPDAKAKAQKEIAV